MGVLWQLRPHLATHHPHQGGPSKHVSLLISKYLTLSHGSKDILYCTSNIIIQPQNTSRNLLSTVIPNIKVLSILSLRSRAVHTLHNKFRMKSEICSSLSLLNLGSRVTHKLTGKERGDLSSVIYCQLNPWYWAGLSSHDSNPRNLIPSCCIWPWFRKKNSSLEKSPVLGMVQLFNY